MFVIAFCVCGLLNLICCCILRVIYISWCIFLCLGVCWVYCIYFILFILSVALVFIFSVFAFVFLSYVCPLHAFPLSSQSRLSVCFHRHPVSVPSVSCFILPVCVLCALCSALPPPSCQCAISVSSGPSSPHPVYVSLPLTVAAIIPICCISMWAMFQSLIPSGLILVYSS